MKIKDIALTKQRIRNKILLGLKTQKEEDRSKKSKIIKEKLFKTTAFKQAKKVMFYISLEGEVETKDMIKEAQKLGKIIVVPVCWNRTIIACVLDSKAKLQKGFYGVWEPVNKRPVALEHIDLVVVPGVAFTKKGTRLGRGKGYYDRFLKRVPSSTPSIGLAFDFQILPAVPSTTRDVNIDKVICA